MDIEALSAVGIFALILGVILLIPGLWWARRKAKTLPESALGAKRVTLFGIVYIGLFLSVLLVVLKMQYFAPGVSDVEKLSLFTIVFLVGLLGEKLANKLGFKLFSSRND